VIIITCKVIEVLYLSATDDCGACSMKNSAVPYEAKNSGMTLRMLWVLSSSASGERGSNDEENPTKNGNNIQYLSETN